MPIAFPPPLMGAWFDRPSGLVSPVVFAAVPAPNMERLGRTYRDPQQTAVLNPSDGLKVVQGVNRPTTRVFGEQSLRIIGVSRDAAGAPLGTCVVKVFRTDDDLLVATTTSDGSGNWTAYPNQVGPYYFVEYKVGAPDVFGTSPNTNTFTTFTPGA